MGKKPLSFPDHNQNFWQLASIQISALGLPGILVGGYVAEKYGASSAIISVIIGNLILWMIGLAVISMTTQKRTNAIENVKDYLGKLGAWLAAFILIIAFLTWFSIQIQSSIEALTFIIKEKNNLTLRLGAAFGFFITLISIKGIKIIKWICIAALPFLVSFLLYSIGTSRPDEIFKDSFQINFSIYAIVSVMAVTLPGIVNLPTFFRHAKSKAHSLLALSLLTLFVILFQCFSILMGISKASEVFAEYYSDFFNILTILFIIISLVCINLVNIYFASAGWEMIVPRATGPKEFAIVGLLGTAAYTFLQISRPMLFINTMTNNFIATLGIVLLFSFLVKIIVRHRPRSFEKGISITCWLVGCFAAFIMQIRYPEIPSRSLLTGLGASSLFFIIVVFAEETIWSLKKLILKKKKSR